MNISEIEKGTNVMNIKLDEFAIPPTRAHKSDAGLDLRAPYEITVSKHSSVVIDTGVHVQLPAGTVGFLKSKSGLNVIHGITGEGVIDEEYTGSIRVKLYNNSDNEYYICKGDKIIQLVVLPVCVPELEYVNELKPTNRGENGFGSSGK